MEFIKKMILKKVIKEEKPSVIKDFMKNPDDYKMEICVENEEIRIKINKKDMVIEKNLSNHFYK